MPVKRKRGGDDDPTSDHGGAKHQRLQHKLAHGTTKLGHAFKVAKGFERQKLGRRYKNAGAQGSDADLKRIDTEISALKALDTTSAAKHFLYKTLNKIKAVASSDPLSDLLKSSPSIPSDTASLNVNARLCNSKPVKDALSTVLADVQHAAGIQVDAQVNIRKKRLRAKDYEPGDGAPGHSGEADAVSPSVDSAASEDVDLLDYIAESATDGLQDEEYAGYSDRVASSGETEDENDSAGDQSPDIADLERRLGREGFRRGTTGRAGSIDEKYIPPADGPPSDTPIQPSPRSVLPRASSRPTTSVLLPSLSMGGYISGSDGSEIEDIDVAPKKNRPGQKARQAIWEKKYGARAKHLQSTANDRDRGWDPKRGATEAPGSRGLKGGVRRDKTAANRSVHGSDQQGAKGQKRQIPSKKETKDDSGPLHPSWEAAKRAKEKAAKAPIFEGKKISFD